MISVDLTLLVNWAIFLVLLVVLSRVFFRPMASHLDRRREIVSKTLKEAETLKENAQEAFIRYTYQLDEAKGKILEEKGKTRRKLDEEIKTILSETRREANLQIQTTTTRIEKELATVEKELLAEAEQLAGRLTDSLLGESMGKKS